MKIFTSLLLFFLSFNLMAQSGSNTSSSKTDVAYNKYHFSTNVGALISGEGISLDAVIGGGYRFTRRSAIGLDLRAFAEQHDVKGRSVVGLDVFYAYNRGIFYKGGFGIPLRGGISDSECYDKYVYRSLTGYYIFSSIGYHTKKGFSIGLNYSVADRIKFDVYHRKGGCYDEMGSLVLSENVAIEDLGAFTLSLGYELPILKSNTPNTSYKTFFYERDLPTKRFFGEFNVGLFRVNLDTRLDFELSGNYRLSKFLFAGLEMRYFYSDEEFEDVLPLYRVYRRTALGAHLAYDNGLYFKYGLGILLTGDYRERLVDVEITGGNYNSIKLGYHFSNGILVGVNYSSLKNMQVHFDDRLENDQLGLIGLLIGYTWPN